MKCQSLFSGKNMNQRTNGPVPHLRLFGYGRWYRLKNISRVELIGELIV